MHNDTFPPPPRVGWQSAPNQRGTIDIIWSCCLSIFLCSWSIICMNVPGTQETQRQIFFRKFCLTVLSIVGPELTFTFACCQWLHVRESVRDIAALAPGDILLPGEKGTAQRAEHLLEPLRLVAHDRKRWNTRKAFFAEMGGIRLRTKDEITFPLDAKQLHFLVSKRYIGLPDIDEEEIRDKNKSDGLLRAITLCQVLWFVLNVVGRWAQRLTVTTFELTAFSFILCNLGTALFWWRKPADVRLPKYIKIDLTVDELMQREKRTFTEADHTPLDFVNRVDWWGSRIWSHDLNILRRLHLSWGSHVHPIDRFGDSVHKPLTRRQLWTIAAMFIPIFAIFFAAWNHSFPTRVEGMLWRIAAITMMCNLTSVVLYCELALLSEKLRSRDGTGPQDPKPSSNRAAKSTKPGQMFRRLDQWMDRVRNNDPGKDPRYRIPLKLLLYSYMSTICYISARSYILLVDLMELRSLEPNAYEMVDWQRFWPHLG